MTDTPRPWDRLPTETPKSYAAFLAYVALGARRSVREAARQNNIKARSSGDRNTMVKTTVSRWLGWSARHKWVSRNCATVTEPEHFHVWRIAATGTAAFMSRAYLKRATAAHAGGEVERGREPIHRVR